MDINLFEEDMKEIGLPQWLSISQLQNDPGGENLIVVLEGRIRAAMSQLIGITPSDIGAVAQLQARINEAGILRDFLKMEPDIVRAQIAEAEAQEQDVS